MKIERLEINNFRGIPNLVIEPEGENICLVGPNGSGKSSVTSAIDFLLTGKVRDLQGEGMGNITVPRYGPHINSEREDSWVEATFSNSQGEFQIRRTAENRNDLKHDGELPSSLESLIKVAKRGQHYLSRREILNFIVARRQSRSEQIRNLLDLGTIREKRLELNGAAEDFDSDASRFEREHEDHLTQLFNLFEDVSDLDDVLEKVNEFRVKVLDGSPLSDLSVEKNFRSGLESPSSRASATPLQSKQTKELLEVIRKWFESTVNEFLEKDSQIRSLVRDIREEEETLRDLEVLDLIRKGKSFLEDEPNRCPLCLTEWDPQELQELLKEREDKADKAKKKKNQIDETKDEALEHITEVRTAIESLIDILEPHDDYDEDNLIPFKDNLVEWERGLENNLIESLPFEEEQNRENLLELEEAESYIQDLYTISEGLPELDRLEKAWDTLNSAYGLYKKVKELEKKSEVYRQIADEMSEIHEKFIGARDDVLTDVYNAISEKFGEYYTKLHEEEEDFSPEIAPTETGLDIEVGFHGHGEHPPHALHSEGHQDSMGLCLFLALCNYLEGDDLSLIMLDDVVMSIDAQHRRSLARLLSDEISQDYQLVITTHDDLWYRHLKTAGVVKSKNAVKFTDWTLEEGPLRVDQLADDWDRIDDLLDQGDVEGAAHRLRYTAEWFLREACHQLGAKVRFKSTGRWNLGDFIGPAMSRFKELIKKAKSAEQSWGNEIEDINELDDRRSEVYERIGLEQGSINPNVHFNENRWSTFTPTEMREVVEAFRDLYGLFWCDNCGSCVTLLEENHEKATLKCACGQKANWTLQEQD